MPGKNKILRIKAQCKNLIIVNTLLYGFKSGQYLPNGAKLASIKQQMMRKRKKVSKGD